MNDYYFECREFGVSDNGIHLLRSGYNYQTIEFNEIDSLVIERGKELNNWLVILLIGLALVSFAIYYSFGLFDIFGGNEVRTIYIEEILVPLGPMLLGGYCVYSSLKNGTVLRVRTITEKVERFPLRDLEKQDKIEPFQNFLKAKLHSKIRISV